MPIRAGCSHRPRCLRLGYRRDYRFYFGRVIRRREGGRKIERGWSLSTGASAPLSFLKKEGGGWNGNKKTGMTTSVLEEPQ